MSWYLVELNRIALCPTPDAVRAHLELTLSATNAAFDALISGVALVVWVVQPGEGDVHRVTHGIDLHDFIRVDLGRGAETLASLWADDARLREWGEEMDEVDPWLERVKLDFFWDPVAERLPLVSSPRVPDEFVARVDASVVSVARRTTLRAGTFRLKHLQLDWLTDA